MKLDFAYKKDNTKHEYCLNCHDEAIETFTKNGQTFFKCLECKTVSDRRIVIDPKIKWWVDDNNEYCHEASGVFIRNSKGKFLFFKRNKFPFVYTIPAGHIEVGEEPSTAAYREVAEEVGLTLDNLKLITTIDLPGESCSRGSDYHKWYAYLTTYTDDTEIKVLEEGGQPVWLTLQEAINLGKDNLTYSNRKIILQSIKQLTQ